jgi:hypothetical protein
MSRDTRELCPELRHLRPLHIYLYAAGQGMFIRRGSGGRGHYGLVRAAYVPRAWLASKCWPVRAARQRPIGTHGLESSRADRRHSCRRWQGPCRPS